MTVCVLQITKRIDGLEVKNLSGMYVKEYNPKMDWEGNYDLIVCDKKEEAMVFIDEGEAHEYYRQVCPNVPTLLDGKPNRPLTSWRVQIIPVEIREE